MKKKIIAISLITAMVVCNSMTVWAADTWSGNNTYSKGATENADETYTDNNSIDQNSGRKNVTGTYDLSTTGTESFSVEIIWGDMTYKMKEDAGTDTKGNWNAEKKWYDITNFDGWESTNAGTADKITINNKSNVAIKATFTGTIDCGENSVLKDTYGVESGSVTFTGLEAGNVLNLETYEGAVSVPTGESTVGVTGTIITKAPSLKNDTGLKLGTVTVTIAKQ